VRVDPGHRVDAGAEELGGEVTRPTADLDDVGVAQPVPAHPLLAQLGGVRGEAGGQVLGLLVRAGVVQLGQVERPVEHDAAGTAERELLIPGGDGPGIGRGGEDRRAVHGQPGQPDERLRSRGSAGRARGQLAAVRPRGLGCRGGHAWEPGA
jgi:hypothetical protein